MNTTPPQIKEQVQAIFDGCEGVTPGPWDTGAGLVRSIDGDVAIPIFESRDPWKKHRRTSTVMRQEWHNRQHIARLDPDTVKTLCILALRGLEATANEPGEAVAWDIQEFKVWKGLNPDVPQWAGRGFCCQSWSGANNLMVYLSHNDPSLVLRVAPITTTTHPAPQDGVPAPVVSDGMVERMMDGVMGPGWRMFNPDAVAALRNLYSIALTAALEGQS